MSGFYNLSASQTTRAYLDTFHRAVALGTDFQEIRPEFAFCPVLGVTDIMADLASFSANFAYS
jgi:hypothetical protein